ncbi:hypothetical protein IKD82_03150 [Candidatus Saccharibacteria bacterium]|nr:hypothetical protein [Candidatus Saccharibacteria bacterium]
MLVLIMIDCAIFWGTVISTILAVLGKVHVGVPIVLALVTALYTILILHYEYRHAVHDNESPDIEIEDVDEAIKEYHRQGDAKH